MLLRDVEVLWVSHVDFVLFLKPNGRFERSYCILLRLVSTEGSLGMGMVRLGR